MAHPQRGKRLNWGHRPNEPGQQHQQQQQQQRQRQHRQQQQHQVGAQRSEDELITKRQRTELAKLGKESAPRVSPLTISTRGIGLTISRVTSVIRQRLRPGSKDIPVAEIYRASLAQLQAKMSHLRTTGCRNDFYCNSGFKYAQQMFPKWDMREAIRHNRDNLSQVALIIDSVGNVEVNGKMFTPVLLKEPNALNVRLDNLREYCVKMSKLETDPSERIQGYELNSIPNAKWERRDENDEKSIVLTNPDEIIPPDYDWNNIDTVLNDLKAVSDWLYELHLWEPHMREWRVTINDGDKGDPGMLVSTHVIPGQSLKLDNEVISGSQSQFWSSEPIPQVSWCIGALGLVGETLNPMDGSSRSNIGGMRTVLDWHQISGMTVV